MTIIQKEEAGVKARRTEPIQKCIELDLNSIDYTPKYANRGPRKTTSDEGDKHLMKSV